jgi:hypothetical protein
MQPKQPKPTKNNQRTIDGSFIGIFDSISGDLLVPTKFTQVNKDLQDLIALNEYRDLCLTINQIEIDDNSGKPYPGTKLFGVTRFYYEKTKEYQTYIS